MTDAPELPPCPFCRGTNLAVFRHVPSQPNRSVMCRDCKGSAISEERWSARADLHQQALDDAREEGRRAGLEEAAKYHIRFLMERTSVPVEKVVASTEAIRALIDKPGDAQKEG